MTIARTIDRQVHKPTPARRNAHRKDMILLADSGSTKTSWALLNKHARVASCSTQGYSPSHQSAETMEQLMRMELSPEILKAGENKALKIYYYGTGCSTEAKKNAVKKAIQNIFKTPDVKVEHDLLAAAIALCGDKPGIACILGTGSNSCYYNGEEIIENVPSLAYMFGDHGSGFYIGKRLLQDYFDDKIPAKLKEFLSKKPEFEREYILEQVYKKPMPQRFVASYTKTVSAYLQEDYMREMVKDCFRDFFVMQVEKYSNHKELPVSFVGSIAFHFKELLLETLAERDLQAGIFLKEPMEGLIEYHLKEA